jgi:transposase InsO family protein
MAGLPPIGPLVWLGCDCSWFETELGENKERVRDEMEKVLLRHGYPWVPPDQAHGRPRQVGPAY